MNMKKTEKEILREITRLIDELDVATYGDDKHKCRNIPPSAYRFYHCTTQIFKLVDEVVANYHPDYISNSDYYFICDCERSIRLGLDVLKDNKRLSNQSLTWAVEPYLEKLQSLFKDIAGAEVHIPIQAE